MCVCVFVCVCVCVLVCEGGGYGCGSHTIGSKSSLPDPDPLQVPLTSSSLWLQHWSGAVSIDSFSTSWNLDREGEGADVEDASFSILGPSRVCSTKRLPVPCTHTGYCLLIIYSDLV